VSEGSQVRRRRECLDCKERYTTFESAELVMPKIIKRDGRDVVVDFIADLFKAHLRSPIFFCLRVSVENRNRDPRSGDQALRPAHNTV